MKHKIELLGRGPGKIVYNTNDYEDIFCLSKAETIDLFKSSGVILFRGFGVTPMQMKDFAGKFSCSYLGDANPKRPTFNSVEFINSVNAGTDAIGFHAEYGFTFFRPDVIWFCCKTPVKGGETIVADGVQIWKEMSKHTQQFFRDKKLKFANGPVGLDHLNKIRYVGETFDDWRPILDKIEGLSYQINEDSTISGKYICSAVVKTKFGNQDAFANSLCDFAAYTDDPFEDDSKLPDEVADEIDKLCDNFTEEISWQAGDLVMIDNSRFMHGRREFKDNQREVFSTLTNLSLD